MIRQDDRKNRTDRKESLVKRRRKREHTTSLEKGRALS
jgi:hypothetical protein